MRAQNDALHECFVQAFNVIRERERRLQSERFSIAQFNF